MPYSDKLLEIDDLRATIQSHGPLPPDVLKKVNYKFRLEWNYTSNSMEGNSLTRSETRSVMIGNITVHGKPIKDVLEMKGHDEVIAGILKMGAGEVQLSETRIRDIHKGIMHEDDPEKASLIGKWKTQDNYLFNYKKERIDFTPHAEVPDAMHQLLNWLSAEREKIARGTKDALHPALLAFRFHLEYVSIHPFYDGNGRTGRILTNLILIAYGYPPVWIKEVERDAYYQYLADIQGYGGSPDVFYEFMAGRLLRSQQLVLDAVEGKEIEEPDDVDKEIALFKMSLNKKHERKHIRSWETIANVLMTDGIPLFERFHFKMSKFNDFFHHAENRIIFNTNQASTYDLKERKGGSMLSTKLFPNSLINWLSSPKLLNGEIISFGMEHYLKGFKWANPFDLNIMVVFNFDEYSYHILWKAIGMKGEHYTENNYDEHQTEEEITYLVNNIAKSVLNALKESNREYFEPEA